MKIISTIISLIFSLSACSAASHAARTGDSNSAHDLGVIPIGVIPHDLGWFESTDCKEGEGGLSDCSALDEKGRRYAFFDGALSIVSAQGDEVSSDVKLPAGMAFGEEVELSARKAESFFGVGFDSAESGGLTIYVSKADIRSSSGALFILELMGDEDGRLMKVVQRTDF